MLTCKTQFTVYMYLQYWDS